MKKLLFVLAAVFIGTGIAGADVKVSGYMAPNIMLAETPGYTEVTIADTTSVETESNIGFGMYFNRVALSGKLEGGKMLAAVNFKFEVDVRQKTELQWAYVEPWFTKQIGFRFGNVKRPFSREVLHQTYNLLTAMRHPTSTALQDLGYAGYSYGLEGYFVPNDRIRAVVGSYAGGTKDIPKAVLDQDPAIDFGGRVVAELIPGLELGANAYLMSLPDTLNAGTYDKDAYESNSGLALGGDVDFQTELNGMALWAQAEVGMGDNWTAVAKNPVIDDDNPVTEDPQTPWKDRDWNSFMYYYLKFRFMVTKDLGVHFGYSWIDENTDSDFEDDVVTTLTPGFTYFWGPFTRTEVEVQMQAIGKCSTENAYGDDIELTNFLIQQVLVWE